MVGFELIATTGCFALRLRLVDLRNDVVRVAIIIVIVNYGRESKKKKYKIYMG